ncbi:MAG: hypothetical protein BWY59_01201 [Verrucomicrobia bacterium ADurb.Bin345]|nr:MAG: hypothetical protein BWY59_01201 [Verrucomicrobia bacterium ADurb.Bin345]
MASAVGVQRDAAEEHALTGRRVFLKPLDELRGVLGQHTVPGNGFVSVVPRGRVCVHEEQGRDERLQEGPGRFPRAIEDGIAPERGGPDEEETERKECALHGESAGQRAAPPCQREQPESRRRWKATARETGHKGQSGEPEEQEQRTHAAKAIGQLRQQLPGGGLFMRRNEDGIRGEPRDGGSHGDTNGEREHGEQDHHGADGKEADRRPIPLADRQKDRRNQHEADDPVARPGEEDARRGNQRDGGGHVAFPEHEHAVEQGRDGEHECAREGRADCAEVEHPREELPARAERKDRGAGCGAGTGLHGAKRAIGGQRHDDHEEPGQARRVDIFERKELQKGQQEERRGCGAGSDDVGSDPPAVPRGIVVEQPRKRLRENPEAMHEGRMIVAVDRAKAGCAKQRDRAEQDPGEEDQWEPEPAQARKVQQAEAEGE